MDGDTVLVIATPVRANKRQDFEQFVDTFWSAGLRSADSAGFKHVRVLRPVAPNRDSTLTYFIIFDPLQPGGAGLDAAVKKLFPPAKADSLLRQFMNALAGEQTISQTVQTRF
jgi:hypothetical protein